MDSSRQLNVGENKLIKLKKILSEDTMFVGGIVSPSIIGDLFERPIKEESVSDLDRKVRITIQRLLTDIENVIVDVAKLKKNNKQQGIITRYEEQASKMALKIEQDLKKLQKIF